MQFKNYSGWCFGNKLSYYWWSLRGKPWTHHSFCPTGPKSWFKFEFDKPNVTNIHYKHIIYFPFRTETHFSNFIFWYSNSHYNMSKNQNKSLNSTMWAQCPKRVFCGIHGLNLSVCDAICTLGLKVEDIIH